jgi:hypothetical protein
MATFTAPASAGVVLGGKAYGAPNGAGWGAERPHFIYNGGDASGSIRDVRWISWGGSTAIGWGKNPIFKPGGGYYRRPATIKLRASAIGRCEGRRAYLRLSVRVPKHPGGRLGPWRSWSGSSTICSRTIYRLLPRRQLFRSTDPFLACDNPSAPNYAFMKHAPRRCFLGLQESAYQSQPVAEHSFDRIVLRKLRWRHWGRRTTQAQGLVCDLSDGRCEPTLVLLWRPERVGPAGDAWIYQRIRVRRDNRVDPARHYFDWFQPGLDY